MTYMQIYIAGFAWHLFIVLLVGWVHGKHTSVVKAIVFSVMWPVLITLAVVSAYSNALEKGADSELPGSEV